MLKVESCVVQVFQPLYELEAGREKMNTGSERKVKFNLSLAVFEQIGFK